MAALLALGWGSIFELEATAAADVVAEGGMVVAVWVVVVDVGVVAASSEIVTVPLEHELD